MLTSKIMSSGETIMQYVLSQTLNKKPTYVLVKKKITGNQHFLMLVTSIVFFSLCISYSFVRKSPDYE